MTDPTSDKRPETGADSSPTSAEPSDSRDAPVEPKLPDYKGAPLDAEAGPGLGCFWLQVVLLVVLLIVTPLTVVLAFPPWVSAALLILTLVILFFVGMTMVFLLRLVAADRRTRRRPLAPTAGKTIGDLEEETASGETSATASDEAMASSSDEDDAAPDEPLA